MCVVVCTVLTNIVKTGVIVFGPLLGLRVVGLFLIYANKRLFYVKFFIYFPFLTSFSPY